MGEDYAVTIISFRGCDPISLGLRREIEPNKIYKITSGEIAEDIIGERVISRIQELKNQNPDLGDVVVEGPIN